MDSIRLLKNKDFQHLVVIHKWIEQLVYFKIKTYKKDLLI